MNMFKPTKAKTIKEYMAALMLGYGGSAAIDGEYIAEKNKAKLGKVSVGKSCIRFKKISDLNLDELKKIIKLAEKSPGLVSVGAVKA